MLKKQKQVLESVVNQTQPVYSHIHAGRWKLFRNPLPSSFLGHTVRLPLGNSDKKASWPTRLIRMSAYPGSLLVSSFIPAVYRALG